VCTFKIGVLFIFKRNGHRIRKRFWRRCLC